MSNIVFDYEDFTDEDFTANDEPDWSDL